EPRFLSIAVGISLFRGVQSESVPGEYYLLAQESSG
ncbi:hypothetical protein HKBW3C_02869, partial [Candidatus Hakubella thermalkaliphila]